MLDLNGHAAIRDLVETELRRRGTAWDLHVVEAVIQKRPEHYTADSAATHALIALRELRHEGKAKVGREDWDNGMILYHWEGTA